MLQGSQGGQGRPLPSGCVQVLVTMQETIWEQDRDSAKNSRFIKVRVHTHGGGKYGRTEEESHLEEVGCLGRGSYQLWARGGYGSGSWSLRLLISVPPAPVICFFWRVERLQNHDVDQHGCQLWLRLVLTCLNYFMPQKIGRVAMGGQVYSHQSCLQCPNLVREGRGRAWFSVPVANCPASLSLHCCMIDYRKQ